MTPQAAALACRPRRRGPCTLVTCAHHDWHALRLRLIGYAHLLRSTAHTVLYSHTRDTNDTIQSRTPHAITHIVNVIAAHIQDSSHIAHRTTHSLVTARRTFGRTLAITSLARARHHDRHTQRLNRSAREQWPVRIVRYTVCAHTRQRRRQPTRWRRRRRCAVARHRNRDGPTDPRRRLTPTRIT